MDNRGKLVALLSVLVALLVGVGLVTIAEAQSVSTTTSVTSSANPSVFGQVVTFTATVTAKGKETGTVTFRDGTTTLQTVTLSGGTGKAAFSTGALAVGSHAITAVYSGDSNFSGSTSPILTQAVNAVPQATTTALTSSVNPSVAGQAVTFTATVTSASGGIPTGTVSFKDGATTLGTGTLNSAGQATFATSALAAGSHSITAVYGGSTNYSGSTSATLTQTVNVNQGASTTTAVASSANPSVFGQAVTFTATVTSATNGRPTGTVTFKDGTTTLGTGPLSGGSGKATFSTSTLAVGPHSITAVYTGDSTFSGSTSSILPQTVNQATTTTTLTSSTNPSTAGQTVTFTATVNPVAPGAGTPTGTVTFRDGTTTLGTATLNASKQATFSTSTLAVGLHSITAVYGGDSSFSGSTSTALTQTVSQAATTTTLTSSTNPSTAGQTVTFTATVNPVAPGAGTPTGTVTFKDGTTTLGTGTLNASNQATFGTSTLAVGSHTITAVYGGDASFSGSTSAALTQTVNGIATTTAVTSSANPSTPGQTVTFTATVSSASAGTPTGTVTFRDGTTTLGTGTLNGAGQATFGTSTLAVGSHTITAVYGGDATFSGSTSPALTQTVSASSCTGNPIVVENCLTGNPSSEWDITGAGDPSIQGFATDISVNRGDTISFKISTNAHDYHLDIYRMGYYGGMGARFITTLSPSVPLPQSQPSCLTQATTTGLIDCGNWAVSASWAVPTTATSGIYFAKAVRTDTNGASHIVFIVRDDASTSALLFQASDTTWQAYNNYGGNSLYTGGPGTNPSRAYKVSYNRPFNTRAVDGGQDWVFNAEYPMVRWLEANGYDVSYFTGADADRRGSLILNHKAYMSVGHDEYWSGFPTTACSPPCGQRANVEAARNAGVHLAFFSGNEIFWKTRWEASIDGSSTPYRVLVSYKETHANAVIDPADPPTWTGTWRDPRFSPPADGGRPENALSGNIFMVNDGASTAIQVPDTDGKMRFWRNTTIASLAPGATATLPDQTLGYEWDSDLDNGARPAGVIRMSTTTVTNAPVLQDFGSTYGSGTAIHHLTLYRHPSGALVFGAGTVQWSWGLDADHDRGSNPPDPRMQQATVNLLADMGVQPGTLQSGLILATASTDATPPASTITSPAAGANVPTGSSVTITGTATDTGGGVVGGVEVSVDGGVSWHPATGRGSWSYAWTTPSTGATVTIKSRAVDDSGNLETPSAGVTVTVGSGSTTCPCSVWGPSTIPTTVDSGDPNGVELGVKFQSNVNGYVTGVRFYKASTNTGTHIGNVWTTGGSRLATATFTNETASGWQQVTFGSPVPVTANTTYVASYLAPNGHYSDTQNYFTSAVSAGPLTFLADGTNGPDGVFVYGSDAFPNQGFNASNYWVDVVFTTTVPAGSVQPTVIDASPRNGAISVALNSSVTATFNEAMDPSTITPTTFRLVDASSVAVPANVSYNSTTQTATLVPTSSLAFLATYTATITTGVKDTAGNALAAPDNWSFTTAGRPPGQGPGGPVLVITTASDPFTTYYTEILLAEGLNLFDVADIGTITSATLGAHDVAILGQMSLTPAQVTMLSNWVNSGGNLIAMRPDKQLSSLLGLVDAGSTLSNAYLQVNTSTPPGAGLEGQTLQFHGTADKYTVSGATAVATLYSNATTATSNPAVTLRSVGSGRAAAFTYDLARSVVYTRQGNQGWAGQERDGITPIRSDDLYFGDTSFDVQPDWIDLNKVAIPQADEQQRLLANLILFLNANRTPLPRFWYFPRGLKAVVLMTGDDHANGGTAGRFDQYIAASPAGCSVDNWECVRSTSYIYVNTIMTDAIAAGYNAKGFEIALHVLTGCADWTPSSLANFFNDQLATFQSTYPSLPPPVTNRTHCIVWSDWATHAKVELAHNMGLEANYYYWPPSWILDRPGLFTGSGMPMRFADLDGTLIDVYQATTQMTDESQQSYPFTIDTLLGNALGPQGYYGVFTANMHTDFAQSAGSDAIVASAQSHGVPIVSSRQMLQWIDARNSSSFGALTWDGANLGFTIGAVTGANGLQVLVPATSPAGAVASVTQGGQPVNFTTQTIKGVSYASFTAVPGTYAIRYQ